MDKENPESFSFMKLFEENQKEKIILDRLEKKKVREKIYYEQKVKKIKNGEIPTYETRIYVKNLKDENGNIIKKKVKDKRTGTGTRIYTNKYRKPKILEPVPENPPENYVRYKNTHGNDTVIICTCGVCGFKCEKKKSEYERFLKRKNLVLCCDRRCRDKYRTTKFEIICSNTDCKKIAFKKLCHKNKNDRYYCGDECRLLFTNEVNRSVLEIYLECKIKDYFPDIKFSTNDRKKCDGFELDFYFPDLKIGIEINGRHHYEDIYGILGQTINRDKIKHKICKEKEIKLFTLKSVEDSRIKGIKERNWKIFKNILMSHIPYCETKEDCISELYNPESKILDECFRKFD